MAEVHDSTVTLRVFDDRLDPAEITQLLRCEPSHAWKRGEVRQRTSCGAINSRTGIWLLEATKRQNTTVDEKINEVLHRTESTLEAWEAVKRSGTADIYCGVFLDSDNEALQLSSETIGKLASRGLNLWLDIYGSEDREDLDCAHM